MSGQYNNKGTNKILFVLPSPQIGGAETKTLNILRYNNSFENILITHSIVNQYFKTYINKLYNFEDYCCNFDSSYSPNNIYLYAKAIKKVVSIEKPNILFGIMHNGTLYCNVARDIYRLKSTVIGTIEGSISGYFSMIKKEPKIYERLLIKYCMLRTNAIFVPSKGIELELIKDYGAKAHKIESIYNGIAIENIQALGNETIPIQKDCPWIVTACRLEISKDFKTLLQAFNIIRKNIKAKLVIVGEGTIKNWIEQKAKEINIYEDLILTGFQENPFKYMARADVFVLSSFYEGFGNVIIEAMALGIPVVSTNCPSGPSEIITEGYDGFLVPIENAQAMADKCLLLIKDSSLKKHVSENAKKRASDFSIESMINKLDVALRKIAK